MSATLFVFAKIVDLSAQRLNFRKMYTYALKKRGIVINDTSVSSLGSITYEKGLYTDLFSGEGPFATRFSPISWYTEDFGEDKMYITQWNNNGTQRRNGGVVNYNSALLTSLYIHFWKIPSL